MAERLQKIEQTWVDDATGETRKATFEYDENGELVGDKNNSSFIPAGELPADFPGRDIFRRAGYGTIEAVRLFRRRGPFTRIEGIDTLTAQATEMWLAVTPEDNAEVAQASKADATATKLNTQVSETGGGSEAGAPAPPAPDTRRGAKQDGSVGSDSTLGDANDVSALADASIVVDGQAAPAAGHGTQGFIVGDGEGSHLTTNLTAADGATKTQAMTDGGEGESGNTTAAPKGKLPSDFPALADLNAAGINTYAQLAKHSSDYTQIAGIGDAKAKKIADALGE